MAKSFEELECWQKAADLDSQIYNFIMNSKIRTEFELKDQMLRSSGSIADNIAEGFERGGNKEFIQFPFRRALQVNCDRRFIVAKEED